MTIEKLSNDVQQIKDDLNKLMNSVSSQEEKEEKLIEIRNKANETKNQLEKEMATLNDEEKEKAQVLLDSLNEIINFELSLAVNQQGNNTPEVTEDESNGGEGGQQNITEKGWFGRQREGLKNWRQGLTRGQRNGIRIGGGVLAGAGLFAMFRGKHDYESEIPGYEDMSRKEKRQARKALRKEKKEKKDKKEAKKDRREGKKERREARRERRTARKEKSFWQRPFGKFLKWTGIGTIAYYVSHGMVTKKWNPKDAFNGKKDTDTNPAENGQNNSSENNNSPEAEAPAENTEGNSSGNENDSGNENVETFEAISTDSFSSAALKTLKDVVTLDEDTINNIKATLNNYLQTNPILKKSANGHMKFEIGNKTKFNNTLKQVWNDALSGLNRVKRGVAKTLFDGKLDNIDKTMRELKAKEYENVVFKYLGGIVKETVKAENGNMTVQEFYDSIKRYYPNKNASSIERAILNSGQANKDIKNMDVEEIKNA